MRAPAGTVSSVDPGGGRPAVADRRPQSPRRATLCGSPDQDLHRRAATVLVVRDKIAPRRGTRRRRPEPASGTAVRSAIPSAPGQPRPRTARLLPPDRARPARLGPRTDAPVTLKILLENVLRHAGGGVVREDDVRPSPPGGPAPARGRDPVHAGPRPAPGLHRRAGDRRPGRDARRDGRARRRPARVNPLVPADLVIDHSVQVDRFGTAGAFAFNVEREYERNGERYQLLRWAQTRLPGPARRAARDGHRPPGQPRVPGDRGRRRREADGRPVAFPDTLVGTDSHTTMVNALGVLGYGVGGIEAEAVLLGQPLYQPMPRIVGVRLHGELPRGSTATDLVLVVTQMLRKLGVVGAFVEFAGDGLAGLALADRATISNMSPEFGATATLFPIDDETLAYLRLTGRPAERVALVERYAKEQGLWREPGAGPEFDAALELDLATVAPSRRRPAAAAGPRRAAGPAATELPRPPIPGAAAASGRRRPGPSAPRAGPSPATARWPSRPSPRCTNTSNPTVMVGAGCWPGTPWRAGLSVSPTVKTSLAPGSRAVTGYLERGRADGAARGARLRAGRLRLHDLHRQLRAARRGGRRGRRGERPRRRGGPLGQPQLRGPHPSARPGQLPGLAAARRRLRPGRPRRHRPDHASRSASDRTAGRSMLADIWPSAEEIRAAIGDVDRRRSCSGAPMRASSRATSAGGRCRSRPATATPGTRRRPTSPDRRSSTGLTAEPAPVADIVGARVAGGARRLGDHRPHLAGRLDRRLVARRPVAPGARRRHRSSSTRTAPAAATTR